MYAIQEPIVGLISGLIAGLYRIRKNNIKDNVQKGKISETGVVRGRT